MTNRQLAEVLLESKTEVEVRIKFSGEYPIARVNVIYENNDGGELSSDPTVFALKKVILIEVANS